MFNTFIMKKKKSSFLSLLWLNQAVLLIYSTLARNNFHFYSWKKRKKIPTKLYLLFLYIWTVVLLNTHSDPTCVCMCVCVLCALCFVLCVCVCVCVSKHLREQTKGSRAPPLLGNDSLPHSSYYTKEKSEPNPTHTPSTDEWCWLSS